MRVTTHIGKNLIGSVKFASCCQNCQHCISRTPFDDPTQYACGRLSRPERLPPTVFGPGNDEYRKKCVDHHLWWARNQVAAGMVCDYFVQSSIPNKIVEYEDDYTRAD